MDFKKHTQERYKERFNAELSDSEYMQICELCKSGKIYIEKPSAKKRSKKVVIVYREIFMWCVISKRRKIVKTVYPVSKKDLKSIDYGCCVLAVAGSDLKPISSGGILP